MIVIDASFLIAYYNELDVHNRSARQLMERFLNGEWGRGLLLEYVFLEVVTVLMEKRGLAAATAIAPLLLGAEELDFVPCSDFFQETWEVFRTQAGTTLSFADAAIVAAARNHAPARIATFDAEFRKLPDIEVLPEPV